MEITARIPRQTSLSWIPWAILLGSLVILVISIMFMGGLVIRKPETVAMIEYEGKYFNSAEQMCRDAADGIDPTVLFCDDFEDGVWMKTNGDTDGGFENIDNDGWSGNIFIPWPDTNGPTGVNDGFARCGEVGAVGTNCHATSGGHVPNEDYNFCGGTNTPFETAPLGCYDTATHSVPKTTQGAMGKHQFAPDKDTYSDLYVRFYMKNVSGYKQGHQKLWTMETDGGSGQVGVWNFSNVAPEVRLDLYAPQSPGLFGANQTPNVSMTTGNWYYIEMRMSMNTWTGGVPDENGTIEMWMDDCGTTGLDCTGAGTLRFLYTKVISHIADDNEKFRTLWLENWGNPGSHGEIVYDQFIARTIRIGPMAVP